MNRRKAITGMIIGLAGAGAAFTSYKWFSLTGPADLVFLEHNTDLIAALAETIIPRTDTPGAKDCKVEDFIIRMIKDCADRKTQNKFIDGLKSLKEYSVNNYNKEYQSCSENQQSLILAHFEKGYNESPGIIGKIKRRYTGNSFFYTLKGYTVEGYCTSQPGATMGLTYIAVPGRYQGCLTAGPGQKAWATN